MRHVEPIEPRQLFAALVPDHAFGDGNGVSLSPTIESGILATYGAIYVIGLNTHRHAIYLYKYTDAGRLDTSWGNGGAIRPLITDGRDNNTDIGFAPHLVYDPGTRGLLLSDGEPYRPATVERFTAAGQDDTTWGNGGVVSFTSRLATLTIDRVLPLSGKKILLAYKSVEENGPTTDPDNPVPRGSSDVYLARVNALATSIRHSMAGNPSSLPAGTFWARWTPNTCPSERLKRRSIKTTPASVTWSRPTQDTA